MTKSAHTTPPAGTAARRRGTACADVFGRAIAVVGRRFLPRARAELSKVTELAVPPRDAKAFEVRAGHFFRIVSVEGPQSAPSTSGTRMT